MSQPCLHILIKRHPLTNERAIYYPYYFFIITSPNHRAKFYMNGLSESEMLPAKSLRKKSPCLINHNQLKLKLTDTKNVSYNINTFIHLRIAPLCRCARQKHFSSNWHDFWLTFFTCVYSALQKV